MEGRRRAKRKDKRGGKEEREGEGRRRRIEGKPKDPRRSNSYSTALHLSGDFPTSGKLS